MMHQYRCDNKCHSFEDKPGQLQPPKEQEGDWIGWCHLRSGNLLVLRSTYDLICYFGCASHSDFQSRGKVLDELVAFLDNADNSVDTGNAQKWIWLPKLFIKIEELRQSKGKEEVNHAV